MFLEYASGFQGSINVIEEMSQVNRKSFRQSKAIIVTTGVNQSVLEELRISYTLHPKRLWAHKV